MLSAIKDKFAAVKQKISTNPRLRKTSQLSVVIIFAVAGVVLAGISLANTTTPTTTTSSVSASSDCGKQKSQYTYQVPFGNAAWNQLVCGLPRHPRSAEYASRMFNYGVMNDGTPETANNKGKFEISFGFEPWHENWTRAVYYAKDATTTIQAQVCTNGCIPSNLDDGKNMYTVEAYFPKRKIPWNPEWKVAGGGDNELIIIDEEKGYLYSFSSVKTGVLAESQCGIGASQRLCASSAEILRTHGARTADRKVTDYRTFEGSDGSRGAGINYFATLVTPEEVMAGEIRHALGMGVFNTSFGPECTKEQLAKNDPKVIDVSCATAVAPAAKFEWPRARSIGDRVAHLKNTPIDRAMSLSKTVPQGMRFALDISNAEIENWIRSRPDLQGKENETKANTARVFAKALRDYGWMPVDTTGYGSGIQVAGAMSSDAKRKWESLGITNEKDNGLLYGLFTKDNIYVVDPPLNHCLDGTKSKFYCKYTTSQYPAVASPQTPAPQTPSTPPIDEPEDSGDSTPQEPPATPDPTPQPTPSTPNPTPPVSPQPTTGTTITPASVELPAAIPIQIGWDWNMFEFHQGAQLSWGASSSPHGIKQYVIKKNGKVIYKGSNRSYTDFRIDDGQKYKYELTAIDNKGNVSKTSSFDGTVRCTWFGWSCGFEKK